MRNSPMAIPEMTASKTPSAAARERTVVPATVTLADACGTDDTNAMAGMARPIPAS
jgi:hypothetical protein